MNEGPPEEYPKVVGAPHETPAAAAAARDRTLQGNRDRIRDGFDSGTRCQNNRNDDAAAHCDDGKDFREREDDNNISASDDGGEVPNEIREGGQTESPPDIGHNQGEQRGGGGTSRNIPAAVGKATEIRETGTDQVHGGGGRRTVWWCRGPVPPAVQHVPPYGLHVTRLSPPSSPPPELEPVSPHLTPPWYHPILSNAPILSFSDPLQCNTPPRPVQHVSPMPPRTPPSSNLPPPPPLRLRRGLPNIPLYLSLSDLTPITHPLSSSPIPSFSPISGTATLLDDSSESEYWRSADVLYGQRLLQHRHGQDAGHGSQRALLGDSRVGLQDPGLYEDAQRPLPVGHLSDDSDFAFRGGGQVEMEEVGFETEEVGFEHITNTPLRTIMMVADLLREADTSEVSLFDLEDRQRIRIDFNFI